MKRKFFIILIYLICNLSWTFAQSDTITVRGRVYAGDSIGIPGVIVFVRGTPIGTVTDIDGYYLLSLPSQESALVFYYVGMKTIEVKVRGRTIVNVVFQEDESQLEEVVVAQSEVGKNKNRWKDLDIPEFELPPPTPSARYNLDKNFFSCDNLGCVNEILSTALESNGYDELGYFAVVNGFAAVTRLEKIDQEGYSKPIPERWDTSISAGDIAFWEYFQSLLFGSKGYYRAIVFVITDEYFGSSGAKPGKKEVLAWYNKGVFTLPDIIAEMKFTRKHKVYALIYEFSQTENDTSAKLINPSPLTGKIHLTRANILTWLEKNQMN